MNGQPKTVEPTIRALNNTTALIPAPPKAMQTPNRPSKDRSRRFTRKDQGKVFQVITLADQTTAGPR